MCHLKKNIQVYCTNILNYHYIPPIHDKVVSLLFLNLFLIGGNLLYNIVLVSAIYSQESTISSVQFISVSQSCPILCNPMNCSTLGLPVHHQFPEFTQIHIHRVNDTIQPSHPLSSPSPPAPNPSQHQSLYQ